MSELKKSVILLGRDSTEIFEEDILNENEARLKTMNDEAKITTKESDIFGNKVYVNSEHSMKKEAVDKLSMDKETGTSNNPKHANGFLRQKVSVDQQTNNLPITEYQKYYDALCEDNLDHIQALFQNIKPETEQRLLNGWFEFGEITIDIETLGCPGSLLHRPLHIASANGSIKVIHFLVERGADVSLKESQGNNVFHTLVQAASECKEAEQQAKTTYDWLINHLGADLCVKLMKTENELTLRPVEYAAKLGVLQLLKHMLHTDHIYVTKKITRGPITFRWHDLTDFEIGDRVTRSPLVFLPNLAKSRLSDPDTMDLLESQLFQAWGLAKLHCNFIPVCIWFFLRVATFVLFFTLFMDASPLIASLEKHGLNASDYVCPGLDRTLDRTVSRGILYFLVSFPTIKFILDLIECVISHKTSWNKQLENYPRNAIVDHRIFRVCEFFANLSILLWSILGLMDDVIDGILHSGDGAYFGLVLFITPILCAWSVLYFLQLLPSVGVAINSIQHMVHDTAHFMILYFIFLVPFYILFQNYMLIYSNTGCQEDFQSDLHSMFTLNLMMFHIIDPREYDIGFENGLRFLFLLYTFMCSIILLNFLVALMASTASKSKTDNKIIIQMNRLAVSCLVERRLYVCFSALYCRMRRRYFTVKDGKVYIITGEDRYRKDVQVNVQQMR